MNDASRLTYPPNIHPKNQKFTTDRPFRPARTPRKPESRRRMSTYSNHQGSRVPENGTPSQHSRRPSFREINYQNHENDSAKRVSKRDFGYDGSLLGISPSDDA